MSNMSQRNLSDTPDVMDDPFADTGNDRGFGGYCGANRHVEPMEHFHVETLPDAAPANYGTLPFQNDGFGSIGQDTLPAKMTIGKAGLALRNKKGE